ncbi:hypothetical protein [Kribbella italica]|uniref:Uncharacterized protein n=1 Tax=Kribbella italica TaxID=1540520 RepID=A0A7W9J0R6_9ACTN|nr:hypothetical protein [Kribbella italica]MBB5833511.1 hypothetical protein [Kribbella italica]
MTSLDHRNPPTDLWSGPAADLAAAAGASFAPAEAAEPAQPEPVQHPPTDRIAPAPFDELIDTEPSRHVAAAHATSYGVEHLPDDYAYYPPADGTHSAPGRANRDTRVGPAADRRTAAAAAREHAPATATGSSGNRGDNGKGRRGNGGKGGRPKRSHAAIGAAVVAGTAIVGVVAFILSNGSSPEPQAGGSTDSGRDAAAVAPTKPSNPPAPAAPGTAKADRKPAVAKPSTVKTTAASKTPDTGAESPKFRKGQWIAVLDTYPTDAGMASDQAAKGLAAQLIAAGVPARAMLADGQYPGLVDGGQPTTATWIVYLGPASSSLNAMNACISPKVQKVYQNNACPTYEPATALD